MDMTRSTMVHMSYDPNKHIPDVQTGLKEKLRAASFSLDDLQWQYMIATEWNLATLEELEESKRTAKSRIARQKRICNDMLSVCHVFVKREHHFPTDYRVSRLMGRLQLLWDSSDKEG